MKKILILKFYDPQNIGGEKYLGYLNYNDMIDLISKAIFFIFDYKALGLMSLDALALGSPVITYYKQELMLSIKDCKCMTYVNNYKNILDTCKKYLNTNLSFNEKLNCKNCIKKFKSKNLTMSIMKKVKDYNQRINMKIMNIKVDRKLKVLSIFQLNYKLYSKYKLNFIEIIYRGE